MKNILVTGASGFLGSHVARGLQAQGHTVLGTFGLHPERFAAAKLDRNITGLPLDLTRCESIEWTFREARPHAVVHAAAMADLRPCEEQPELAGRINADAALEIARCCKASGARLVFFSTDQVFDGRRGGYEENDAPDPIHRYGETKAEAEDRILGMEGLDAVVVRVTLVYGISPTGNRSASEQLLNMLEGGDRPRLFVDEFRSPILAEDVALAVSEVLVASNPVPLLHLGGPEGLSRFEIGKALAEAFGYDASVLEPVKQADLNLVPARPGNLTFNTALARKVLIHPPRSLGQGLSHLKAQAPSRRKR